MPRPLTTAVRAYIRRVQPTAREQGGGSRYQPRPLWPDTWCIIDPETRVDEGQAFLFAPFELGEWDAKGHPRVIRQGLVYRDDLPHASPKEFAVLKEYVRTHRPEVADGSPDREILLCPLSEFMNETFRYEGLYARSLMVNFNLPFDFTRLALDVGEGRGPHAGAYSCTLFSWLDKRTGERRPNRFLPRLILKCDGRTRAFIKFAVADGYDTPQGETVRDTSGAKMRRPFQGRFLDLKTLAHALSGEVHSLASACVAFNTTERKFDTPDLGGVTPDAIDYARQDVRAARSLMDALRHEFATHPIELAPDKAFSPASITKAYLRALGVARPMQQFANLPEWLYGAAMVAYYGGRAEARIRKVPVPVVHTDFLSEYPTVGANLGVWELLTAERLEYEDATDEVRALLAALTLERTLDPALWRELGWFAEVKPQGEIFPVRAMYSVESAGFSIGANPLTLDDTTWYAGPDVVASWLATGHAPHVVRAFRLRPHGRQSGLKSLTLADGVVLDAASGDLFRALIEQRVAVKADVTRSPEERARIQKALKIVANSLYGVTAELNEQDPPPDEPVDVHVFGISGGFKDTSPRPELPGEFHFPPAAALITAGGRLMLAILERLVADRGGTYAFCDTDSMAIVATEHGGLVTCPGGAQLTAEKEAAIRALSWAEVDDVVAAFIALNPYDISRVPGSVLAIKEVNFVDGQQAPLFAYAISAKRYTFARPQGSAHLEIIEPKEHGLGHLMDPLSGVVKRKAGEVPEWIRQAWLYLAGPAFDVPVEAPAFLDLPAVTQFALNTPKLWRPFRDAQQHLPKDERVGPCNFVCSANVAKLGHPVGADPTRFHLLMPYTRDAARWVSEQWIDVYSGRFVTVATTDPAPPTYARIKTFRDVLDNFFIHREAKSCDPIGKPCGDHSIGLLNRRPVHGDAPVFLGKESKHAEIVRDGVEHDLSRVQSIHINPGTDPVTKSLIPAIRRLPKSRIRSAIQRSERQIANYLSGRVRPPSSVIARLWQLVDAFPVPADPGTQNNTSNEQSI